MTVRRRWKWAWLSAGAMLLAVSGCVSEEARTEPETDSAAPAVAAEAGTPEPVGADSVSQETPIPVMSPSELVALLDAADAPVVLDVRTAEEYESGHVPGAINIPFDQVPAYLDSLQAFRERGLVVYCRTGKRAGIAEHALQEAGFERLWDLEGHMTEWQASDLPLTGSCC